MADAKFTVISKLMQDYETGTPIDYHNAIAATSDSNGNLLFFSIGTDGHIYVFSPANQTPTGWQRIDLCQGMEDFTAVLLAAEQDEQGAPLLAAVMQSKSTQEYSVFFTKDFTAVKGKDRWVFRGKKGGLQVTNIAAGYGKNGAVLIVITTQQGNQSTNFLVNPNLSDSSWFWREIPSPVNSQHVISTAIGHNSRLESLDEVQGLLYSLYQTGNDGQTWMVITSLPDFTFYNHPIPLQFNPTSFGVTRGNQGDTELVVGEKKLYHLSPELQMSQDDDQVNQGLVLVTSQPAAHNVTNIEVGVMQDQLLEAWFLTQDGKLSRTYQNSNREWVSPLPFQVQVGEMVAWRSGEKSLHEIFTVDLNNRLRRYRQDPQTTLWKGSDILVESLDTHREVKVYVTQLQITDQNGAPMVNQKVSVHASELTLLTINHNVYYADPASDAVDCQTDALGNLTIVNKVEGLSTPTLRLQSDAFGSHIIDVDPAAEVRHQLSNLTVEQLQGAQMQTDTIGVTQPMFPDKSQQELQGSHQALQQLMSMSKQFPSQGGFNPQPSRTTPLHFVSENIGTPMLNRVAYGTLPSEHRWGLDFTGEHPVFTSGQNSHLARFSIENNFAALSTRSVLDDVEHFFGDVWHAIENGFIEVEHWVIQKVSDGIQFIINTAEKAYQVVIKYAEQVWSVIQHVFQQIGASFDQLVHWLGFIFSWKDILRTHDVIRTTFNHVLDKFVAELTTAEASVHNVFTQLKNHIIGNNLAGQLGSWAQGDVMSLNTTGGHPSPLNSPDVNWALHHATSGKLTQYGDATPPSGDFSLSKTIQQDIDQIKTIFNSAVLDLVQKKISLAEFLSRIIEVLEVAVLDTIEVAAIGIIEAVKLAVSAVKEMLNVEWNIPLISPLYTEITGGSNLTLLDLVSLLTAIPATVLYKLGMNEAPFSESVSRALTQTKNLDELTKAIVALDPTSPHPIVVNRAFSNTRAMSFVAVATGNEEPQTTLPIGVRGVSYAFGFAVGIAWIIYGVTNGVMVPMKPEKLHAGDKVKLATGIIVNGLSFVPMALVLDYAGRNIPTGSRDDLPRLRFEMFITTFQVLFNVKDGLTAWQRYDDLDPEGILLLVPVFDFFETVLGVFNFIWFASLAIAEGVEGDMGTNNGLKVAQNICASITQILSVVGDLDKEPISEAVLTFAQVVLGAAPGIITCVRTGLDIQSGEVEVAR